MQKKSLAALVATLFAIPFAAHADVTVYGFISGGIESTKATGNGVSSKDYTSRTRVVDHNSRIGFKGFERARDKDWDDVRQLRIRPADTQIQGTS